MTKMKKIAACAFAAAAMMTSVLSMGANAANYYDSGSWNFYSNPHVSNMTKTINLNAYGGGYLAELTNKSNGGSYNYVTITNRGKQVAMLTELNSPCKTISVQAFEKDSQGKYYASFYVMMHYETATDTETATNEGRIATTFAF